MSPTIAHKNGRFHANSKWFSGLWKTPLRVRGRGGVRLLSPLCASIQRWPWERPGPTPVRPSPSPPAPPRGAREQSGTMGAAPRWTARAGPRLSPAADRRHRAETREPLQLMAGLRSPGNGAHVRPLAEERSAAPAL